MDRQETVLLHDTYEVIHFVISDEYLAPSTVYWINVSVSVFSEVLQIEKPKVIFNFWGVTDRDRHVLLNVRMKYFPRKLMTLYFARYAVNRISKYCNNVIDIGNSWLVYCAGFIMWRNQYLIVLKPLVKSLCCQEGQQSWEDFYSESNK